MANSPQNPVFKPGAGTSLVDRMNISIHLRKYIKLITRRWWIILVCGGIGFGYSYYTASKMEDQFVAYSTLGIAPRVDAGFRPRDIVQEELNSYYENQIQYMNAVKPRVDEKLKTARQQAGMPVSVSADARKGAGSAFVMEVRGNNFEFARKYAEIWAHEFLNYKNEFKVSAIDKTVLSTRQDMQRYQELLDGTRAKIREFLKDNKVGSAKDTGDAAQQLLDKLTTEYTEIVTLRKRLENKTAEDLVGGGLEDSKSKSTTDGSKQNTSNSTDPLAKFAGESRYVELKLSQRTKEAELARLQSTLKPLHPYMIRLKRELADINQQIQFQFDLIKEKREDLIASLKKDEGSYLPLIEAQRNIVIESRGIQLQHEKLKEDEANYKTVLDGLQKSLQAIDLAPSNEERIDIIQAGVGSPGAVGPDRKRIITNGALAGFGLGIAIVFLLHRLDDRLELAEDIEADLEEPVLGQIPQQDASLLKSGRVLVTELDQHNLFSEAIRGVRSAVMFGGNEGSKQVLLVTSAVPGDGKTTFTVNFAATLANAGNRVLLVDADLRRGNVHNYFQHQREPGITEVLSGELHWHDVVRATPIKTLQVITSGQLPPNPGELLISPVMRQFIEEARGEYDHILFDCPPLTAIDDTFCLLSSSDGLMFVVKAGQTSMRFAKNALDAVRQRGAKILGIVLNGITTDHPSYYYNYYYHAYYNKELTQTPGKSVKPATKMASRRHPVNSIAAQAHARVGHDTTAEEIAAEEHRKAEEFKARRAQRQGQDSSGDQPSPAPAQSKDKRTGDVG